MTLLIIFLVALVLMALVLFYPGLRDRWILRRPFPDAWRTIMRRRLPFIDRMRAGERRQLEQMVQIFVARKRFYGCGGLVLNDDIKVTIAAEACLLLLNRRTGLYPSLRHILVYPSAFIAQRWEEHGDGATEDAHRALLGETWDSGKIILSWDDVEHGAADFRDGQNVVLHEFSHQLDFESGLSGGASDLSHSSYRSWAEVLSREFDELVDALEHDHETVMDEYGAESPAEFFAVATETFFEMPYELARRHPRLFEEFKAYYRVDPRRWHG